MSLKYRLIILTVAVFAVTFGAAAILGVHGARMLAQMQLKSRLTRTAGALAASGIQLNDEVLARLGPVLGADLMVIDPAEADGARLLCHSGDDRPWGQLAGSYAPAPGHSGALAIGGRTYYFGSAQTELRPSGREATVLALADESAVGRGARTILNAYLLILAAASVLLAVGMYALGWAMVRRINRLSRTIDQTLSEGAVATRSGGDELKRLSLAFDELRQRLQRSRRRLAQQQQLATTGKLASSIAHEVRNPLQAIRLTVQMIRDKLPPAQHEGPRVILSEIDRLSLLTDELLVLAGKDTLRVQPVDLAQQLDQTARLLAHQMQQRQVQPRIDLPPLPAVSMDPNRCRQLLLNLLLNAVEASAVGGIVRAEGRAGPDGVTICIRDEGPGFPQAVLQGRAEEFFSTKSSGAGLGLSICRRIVEEAGGRLSLYNTDAGAVAEFTLPAAGNAS